MSYSVNKRNFRVRSSFTQSRKETQSKKNSATGSCVASSVFFRGPLARLRHHETQRSRNETHETRCGIIKKGRHANVPARSLYCGWPLSGLADYLEVVGDTKTAGDSSRKHIREVRIRL